MGLFPKEYQKEIETQSKSAIQHAANKLQWAIVDGLEQTDSVHVAILNSLYVGAYPRLYRKIRIPTFSFQHTGGAQDLNVGFWNIKWLKTASRYFSIRKYVRLWAEEKSAEEKVLLIYALTTPFVNIGEYVKKQYPYIKVCQIVPDLPEYMNVVKFQQRGLYYLAKTLEIRMIRRCIQQTDCFVLLTEAMKDYTVMEGIVPTVGEGDGLSERRKKQLLYCGGIKAEYGVLELAKAFIEVSEPEWELVIYGDGVALDALRRLTAGQPHIHLMGARPNHEVVQAQKQASVLVNPRKNQEFTRYSFPSKLLEYMASGTPVLAYKLDGIPEEYDPYYFPIMDKENGLQMALSAVMRCPAGERESMGQAAMQFVRENKNARVQCEKIAALLRAL